MCDTRYFKQTNMEKSLEIMENLPIGSMKSTLNVNIILLKYFGTWPPEDDKNKWSKRLYLLWQIIGIGSLFYLYLITEIVHMIKSWGNLEAMTESSFLLLTHLAQMTKYILFNFRAKDIARLTRQLESPIFQPRNLRQYKLLEPIIKLKYLEVGSGLTFCTFTVVLWAIFPFLDDENESRKLPLRAWYPFDVRPTPIYQLMFIYQIVSVLYNALHNAAKDTFVTGLICQAYMQLDLISDNILNNGKDENVNQKNTEDEVNKKRYKFLGMYSKRNFDGELNLKINEQNHTRRLVCCQRQLQTTFQTTPFEQRKFRYNFVNCIKHHETIVRFIGEVQSLFHWCMFAQFSASVIILCITAFQLTLVKLFSVKFFSMCLYQTCMLMEIFIYCWHGNELLIRSDVLSTAIYKSTWHKCNPSLRKDIRFFLQHAQRPIKIKAGNFFILSLSLFAKIIKTSYSYFAVLQQVHSDTMV